MSDDEPDPCGNCGRTRATWSPAFGAWLCDQCLWIRTERELLRPSPPRPEGTPT